MIMMMMMVIHHDRFRIIADADDDRAPLYGSGSVKINLENNLVCHYGASPAIRDHTVMPYCHVTRANAPCLNPSQLEHSVHGSGSVKISLAGNALQCDCALRGDVELLERTAGADRSWLDPSNIADWRQLAWTVQ